jgi:hypothetical protein
MDIKANKKFKINTKTYLAVKIDCPNFSISKQEL